jgi:hypothetical protein
MCTHEVEIRVNIGGKWFSEVVKPVHLAASLTPYFRISTTEACDKREDLVELLLDTRPDWLLGWYAQGDLMLEVLRSLVDGVN